MCVLSEAGQLTDALVCLTAGLPERLMTAPVRSKKVKGGKPPPPVDINK